MPTVGGSQLPPPKSWDEFEDMCADLFMAEWGDRNAMRHGRQGQRQNGVDIYGRPGGCGYAGVQCKGKRCWPPTELRTVDIDVEVAEALKFRPKLTEFTVATIGLDGVGLQAHARSITQTHEATGLFSVAIMGWGEISRRLSTNQKLIEKHYGYTALATIRGEVAVVGVKIDDVPERTRDLLMESLKNSSLAGTVALSGGDLLGGHFNQKLVGQRLLPVDHERTFASLCRFISPITDDNRRIFEDFGPNSGASHTGPEEKAVRYDLALWRRQRSVIGTNNELIAEHLRSHSEIIPDAHASLFRMWLSHIDAFAQHLDDDNIDYREYQFPRDIVDIVRAAS
jgi:hypothetical protein